MQICVLGLGNMGLPVAVNLAAAGHQVRGVARTRTPEAEAAGVQVYTDGAAALVGCEVVLCLLPDLPYLTPLLPAIREAGARDLVIMSTVSPVAVRELADELAGEIAVSDACMSGGVPKAVDATMSIMCGGSAETFHRLLPLLRTIGGTVQHMGPTGAGAVAKACNQMVVAGTLVALAEATIVAVDNGLDAGEVLDVLGAGLAGSALLDQVRDKLATEDYTPDGPARFLVKDLHFATDSARGRDLPVLRESRNLFEDLTGAGLGALDKAVVLRHLREVTSLATTTSAHPEN